MYILFIAELPVPSVVDRESILFDEEEYIKRVEEIVAFDSFDDMAIQLKELVDQPQLRMGVASWHLSIFMFFLSFLVVLIRH